MAGGTADPELSACLCLGSECVDLSAAFFPWSVPHSFSLSALCLLVPVCLTLEDHSTSELEGNAEAIWPYLLSHEQAS